MKVNSLLFLTLLACAVSMVAQERKADESVERKTTKEQDEAMAAQLGVPQSTDPREKAQAD